MVDAARFVGRKNELADIRRRLAQGRLVTVHGAGGIGKTRLAAQAAEQVRRSFRDGVVLVELDEVREADLLARSVADRCGLPDGAEDPAELLVEYLQDKNLLLVVDGCEHLADAVAALVVELLTAADGLRVLVTSRHVLGVEGEQVLRVFPFAVPDARSCAEAGRLDAVSLFVRCASAGNHEFSMNEDNWRDVVDVCRGLDGIPLAIEIGAALLRFVPLPEIVARVAGDVPAHHQSVESVLAHSYELCTPAERVVWQQLSVFTGGATLAGAEEVCRGGEVGSAEVLSLIAGLIDKAVLHRDSANARYRMLGVVREYGERKAAESGEREGMRRRHRDHFTAFVVRCQRRWEAGNGQPDVAACVMAERPNIRAALGFSFGTHGESGEGLRLVAALGFFWLHCGFLGEGRDWVAQALRAAPDPKCRDFAKALCIDAYAAYAVGDHAVGDAVAAKVLTWGREHDDHDMIGLALAVIGGGALVRGELVAAVELSRTAAGHLQIAGNKSYPLPARVVQLVATAFSGDLDAITALAKETTELADSCGQEWVRTHVTYAVALAKWTAGEHEVALENVSKGLRSAEVFHDRLGLALLVELLSWIHDSLGGHQRAAELLGLASRLWEAVGSTLTLSSPAWIRPHRACADHLEETLGVSGFERGFRRGSSFGASAVQAVEFATRADNSASETGSPLVVAALAPLSRRETQVASLVAEGMTNKAIAARLVVAPRTAETHVDHILTKLGFDSRSQIAVWMTKRQRSR